MTHSELLRLLTDFAAERVALIQRHEAGAQVASHYDFNNTYQYVINREGTHLEWLASALTGLEAALPAASSTLAVPAVVVKKGTADPAAYRVLLEDDASQLAGFIARWQPQVTHVAHARHRRMLDIILGEAQEHQRLFAQAASGFEDVLGRRTASGPRIGGVLATRWVE